MQKQRGGAVAADCPGQVLNGPDEGWRGDLARGRGGGSTLQTATAIIFPTHAKNDPLVVKKFKKLGKEGKGHPGQRNITW